MGDVPLTIAEESIQNLSKTGEISITFIRIVPTAKIIKRRINLRTIAPIYRQVSDDFESAGIKIRLLPQNLVIENYYKLICKLFPDFDVRDHQVDKVGKPDFLLTNNKTQFHIELKNGRDGLRKTQMEWAVNNSDKETWYMFLEDIKVDNACY